MNIAQGSVVDHVQSAGIRGGYCTECRGHEWVMYIDHERVMNISSSISS